MFLDVVEVDHQYSFQCHIVMKVLGKENVMVVTETGYYLCMDDLFQPYPGTMSVYYLYTTSI